MSPRGGPIAEAELRGEAEIPPRTEISASSVSAPNTL